MGMSLLALLLALARAEPSVAEALDSAVRATGAVTVIAVRGERGPETAWPPRGGSLGLQREGRNMPVKDPEREEEAEPEDGRVKTVTDAIRAGIGGSVGGLTGGAGGGGPGDEPLGGDEDAAEIRRSARDDPRQGGERG